MHRKKVAGGTKLMTGTLIVGALFVAATTIAALAERK